MSNDTTHILSLLIIIQVALCSYYYILHRDTISKREEDKLILQLEEKFSSKSRGTNYLSPFVFKNKQKSKQKSKF